MGSSTSLSLTVVRDSMAPRESGIRRVPRELNGDVAELLPIAQELAANLATLSTVADNHERLALRLAVAHALALADQLNEILHPDDPQR